MSLPKRHAALTEEGLGASCLVSWPAPLGSKTDHRTQEWENPASQFTEIREVRRVPSCRIMSRRLMKCLEVTVAGQTFNRFSNQLTTLSFYFH